MRSLSKINRLFYLMLSLALMMTTCSKTPSVTEPVLPEKPRSEPITPNNQPAPSRIIGSVSQNTPPVSVAPAQESAPTPKSPHDSAEIRPQVMEDCDTSFSFADDTAVFLPENKVFITRVMSPCISAIGQRGHKKHAGWMSMGFPCTGGEGRIDWKGTNHARPKMVSFLMETSCAMAPHDLNRLKSEAWKAAKIPESSPLIAFNPFVIQYWEVPGFEDADASLTVELRSGQSLEDEWTKFVKGKPLKVFLVGRENAWVPGNKMYGIDGEIVFASKNRFTFKVSAARQLSTAELDAVKKRCENLRPERACSQVF
jgi:hypothetical protein